MNLPEVAAPIDVVVVLAGGGVVLIVVSLPMWRVWIRRNWIYGARTSVSMSSDENWKIVNRRSGRAGFQSGVALVGVAALLWLVLPAAWPENAYKAVVAVAILGALTWILRELFAAEEQTPRPRVTRWPRGSGGPPRQEESDEHR